MLATRRKGPRSESRVRRSAALPSLQLARVGARPAPNASMESVKSALQRTKLITVFAVAKTVRFVA